MLGAVAAMACAAQTPIDFSYAGYAAGSSRPPVIRAAISVRPSGGDDTALLQAAIDRAGAMPAGADGFRGAVQLNPGKYLIGGHLEMRTSGVALRGIGDVVVAATGSSRRTLIEIGSRNGPAAGAGVAITADAPAGARTLTVADASTFHTGDRVIVTRPSTVEWITALHMRGLPGTYANQRLDWAPGSRNLIWDRTVESVSAGAITIDSPITTALEKRYGSGTIARVTADAPVAHIGLENLTLESETADGKPKDEDHSWIAVALDHVEDAWVRAVTARGFAGSAVRVGPRARRITVEECRARNPISELAGYRRQNFLVEGQQVLVRECESEAGMNDFATGLLAAGPNVFLNSASTGSLGPSGTFESWASGVLYEHVQVGGSGLRLDNDSSRAEGAGWTAANSIAWNCEGGFIDVKGPEGAENSMLQSNQPLYDTLLAKRLNGRVPAETPLPTAATRLPDFKFAPKAAAAPPVRRVEIVNGRFVVDGKTIWGGMINDGWWRGQEVPASALDVGGVALTRYVPGRTGPGLTEDLSALAAKMVNDGTPFYQAIPGLWYDRRRDEHSTNSRPDANVWAPFYEMPWARSGEGLASDGLTQFDLTHFNPWYFGRLREFAELSDRNGLVLYYNLYNMHNTLEIPPHWVDYPWRPANNINDTGLPEPPPFAGNQLHVGNQVYDVANPVRRELHKDLILRALDELGTYPNLFFNAGFQFAGPLAFQEFFQDTVADWQKRTGKPVRLQMATSKDITDAILANPDRARQVSVIDMRYWEYTKGGELFAPKGGQNLAFRELIRQAFPGFSDTPPDTTPQQVYRQVREYHDKYPDKAIVAWHGGAGPIPVLMAGGAQAIMRNPAGGHGQGKQLDRTTLDPFVHEHLADVLMKMQPRDGRLEAPENNWCMADQSDAAVLLYSLTGDAITLAAPLKQAAYTALWFDPRTGATRPFDGPIAHTAGAKLPKPTAEAWLLLLRTRQ